MLEVNEIKVYLEAGGRDFVSDVRIRSFDDAILIYIPREKIAPKVEKGVTSRRQIKNLAKHLSKHFSTVVEVIFVMSESHSELEAGFFQLLNRRFNGQVNSFYLSFSDDKTIDAWIEMQGLDDSRQLEVIGYFSETLEGANLTLGDIQWISAKINLPTTPAILRMIKTMQPVTLDALLVKLRETYDSVDKKWLTKTLDNLRKKDVLLWQQPGSYSLTAQSLAFIPAGTSRSSSDIERALALGRRKW